LPLPSAQAPRTDARPQGRVYREQGRHAGSRPDAELQRVCRPSSNYGAAPWADRLLDTVLRPGPSGRVRPPVRSGVSPDCWAARSASKQHVGGRLFQAGGWTASAVPVPVAPSRLVLRPRSGRCLVTFLSIWLCPDAVSGPRGLAEPRQSDGLARVSWKRRKAISGGCAAALGRNAPSSNVAVVRRSGPLLPAAARRCEGAG
jgi:hypothetical protein